MASPLLLPVLLVTALLVRFKLGSPVFFRQRRIGLGGHAFQLVKFRSMTNNTDSQGVILPDIERLSSFGYLLRSSSLDELPSLWCVLKGEMSLVGPRPLLPEYLPLYNDHQYRRHEVRPGITGWAQINGRNALSWEQKFDLDVWYVDNRILRLDALILFRTIVRVIRRDGISASGDATMPFFTGSGNNDKPVA